MTPVFDNKVWKGELNPLGPPADPVDNSPIDDDGLNDLEERAKSAFDSLEATDLEHGARLDNLELVNAHRPFVNIEDDPYNVTLDDGSNASVPLQTAVNDIGNNGGGVLWIGGMASWNDSDVTGLLMRDNVTIACPRGKGGITTANGSIYRWGSNDAIILSKGTIGTNVNLTKDSKPPPAIPIGIVGGSSVGGTATITTTTPHGLSVGNAILVRGGGGSIPANEEPYYTETNNGVAAEPVEGLDPDSDPQTFNSPEGVLSVIDPLTFTYPIAPRQKPVTSVATTDYLKAIGHGYVIGDEVFFTGLTGGGPELVNGTHYFVVATSGDQFKVAATSGGAIINLTADITGGTVASIISPTLTHTGHIAAFGKIIQVADTSAFQDDDMILLSSNAERRDMGSEKIKHGQVDIIERVISGTTIMLKGAAQDTYLVSDVAKIQKITPVRNVHFVGMTLIGKGAAMTVANAGDKGIRFEYCLECSIDNCIIKDVDLIASEFRTCLTCWATKNTIWFSQDNVAGRASGKSYVQYGIAYANGTEDLKVTHNTVHNSRHCVIQSSSGAIPGICRNITITDNHFFGCWLAAVGSHQGVEAMTVADNHFVSCVLAINVRYCERIVIHHNDIWGSDTAIQITKHINGADITDNIIDHTLVGISLQSIIGGALAGQSILEHGVGKVTITGNRVYNSEEAISIPATNDGLFLRALIVDYNTIIGCSMVGIAVIGGAQGKTVTAVASTDVFTTTAHGYFVGKEVVLSGLTGGAGLEARPYYVISVPTADTYTLAVLRGGLSVNLTTDLTAGTVCGNGFSGSISHNHIEDIGQVLTSHAIRATNARRVHFVNNTLVSPARIDGVGTMGRGIYIDGDGTTACTEKANTVIGNVSPAVQFASGTGHVTDNARKETVVINNGNVPITLAEFVAPVSIDTGTTSKAATGVASTDIITVVGHGYTAGTPVTFPTLTGGAGLAVSTTYFIRDVVGDTFKLAATVGGAAIDFTTDITSATITRSVTGVAATDVITMTNHGFVSGQPIIFSTLTGGSGLATGTNYYVRDVTTDTYKIAATSGGAALDFTTDITNAIVVEAGLSSITAPYNAPDGIERTFKLLTTSRHIVIRHQAGPNPNLRVKGGVDFTMDSSRDIIKASWSAGGSEWLVFVTESF